MREFQLSGHLQTSFDINAVKCLQSIQESTISVASLDGSFTICMTSLRNTLPFTPAIPLLSKKIMQQGRKDLSTRMSIRAM